MCGPPAGVLGSNVCFKQQLNYLSVLKPYSRNSILNECGYYQKYQTIQLLCFTARTTQGERSWRPRARGEAVRKDTPTTVMNTAGIKVMI